MGQLGGKRFGGHGRFWGSLAAGGLGGNGVFGTAGRSVLRGALELLRQSVFVEADGVWGAGACLGQLSSRRFGRQGRFGR